MGSQKLLDRRTGTCSKPFVLFPIVRFGAIQGERTVEQLVAKIQHKFTSHFTKARTQHPIEYPIQVQF